MNKTVLMLTSISVLSLAGCVTQEQADAKMVKGCQAAIGAMLAPRTIKEVVASEAEAEKTEGSVYRRIKLSYVENDDFGETVHEGSCLFAEQWGLMKSNHAAMLEQVVYNGQLIGKKDGEIQGSMDDFMKLSAGADTAMGQ